MELRVACTTADYDRLVRFYTAGLSLEPNQFWHNRQGRALTFDMGRATLVHPPVVTPCGDRNVRLQDPDGMQITLFQAPT